MRFFLNGIYESCDGKQHLVEIYNKQLGINLNLERYPLYGDRGRPVGGMHVSGDRAAPIKIEDAL
jgi:hypothetical protein